MVRLVMKEQHQTSTFGCSYRQASARFTNSCLVESWFFGEWGALILPVIPLWRHTDRSPTHQRARVKVRPSTCNHVSMGQGCARISYLFRTTYQTITAAPSFVHRHNIRQCSI